MEFEFKEKSTLGGGWSIEVRRAGFPLGHIRRDTASGTYLYFNGMTNILTAMLSDDDLGKLKDQIVARL
jgi:hypothetical protein